ncbi:MAG: O-antigen ligase family protein, partial [Nocardioidaceae bacterium]
TGGREPHVLSVACGLLLVAVLLVRPWRTLPLASLLLGNGLGLAAVAVVATAPTGLAGAHEAASYVYAGQLGLVVLAWATTPGRRIVVVAALLAATGLQFAQGWLPWWGHQDVTEPFQGTFYWHNQTGIFMAAGALLAFAVVAAGRRPLASLAWVVGPLCTAGVVLSTSRGSQLGLVVGMLLLLGAAVLTRGMRRGALRLVGVAALSWVVTTSLTGPWVVGGRPPAGAGVPEALPAAAGTAARAGSFISNGVQRFEDWRRALAIFAEWPVTGAGFYSFDSATSAVTTRRDGVATAFAHNGFLQAAADGGLVLAFPLFLAVGLVLVQGARSVPKALRTGDFLHLGAVVTFLVLLLHSGMDFDWTYPALLSLAALVGVLCLAPPGQDPGRSRGRVVGLVLVVLPVLLLGASVIGAWQGGLDLNVAV